MGELWLQMLSADTKVVKLWEREGGKNVTALEMDAEVNDLAVYPDSGWFLTWRGPVCVCVCGVCVCGTVCLWVLLPDPDGTAPEAHGSRGTGLFFVGSEQPKMNIFFVPMLGPAPKWCHYLDSITEELEGDAQPAVYDDYKFVTREELEALGLKHLMGTAALKAYMHGFFLDIKLYNRAKEAADPFAYEQYRCVWACCGSFCTPRRSAHGARGIGDTATDRFGYVAPLNGALGFPPPRQDLIRKKLEEGTESRLQLNKYRRELPKINKALAKRLLEHNQGLQLFACANALWAFPQRTHCSSLSPLAFTLAFALIFARRWFSWASTTGLYCRGHSGCHGQGQEHRWQERREPAGGHPLCGTLQEPRFPD